MSSEETDRISLGDRIRICAKRVGNGQLLSQRTGIPQRTLTNWITGKFTAKTPALIKIAEVANVNLDWLIKNEGPMEKEAFQYSTGEAFPAEVVYNSVMAVKNFSEASRIAFTSEEMARAVITTCREEIEKIRTR